MDFYFFKWYRIILSVQPDRGEAKLSAYCMTSAILSFVSISIINLYGIYYPSLITEWYKNNHKLSGIIITAVVLIILNIRYYKQLEVNQLERQYLPLFRKNQLLYLILFLIITIFALVGFFFSVRFFQFGHF
jgi:uncharacterized membrane protein